MPVELLLTALGETVYMVFAALLVAGGIGIPLGLLLVVTGRGQVLPAPGLNFVLAGLINITRSIPFVILMVAVIPFTRMVVGSAIGTSAGIVPLSLAAIPFVARITESAIREIPPGLVEAGLAMGASPLQVVRRVLIHVALPALIRGLTLTAVNLTSYSAMAGVLGGGGLGNLAVRYGYQRRETAILAATIVVLVLLVQVIQSLGNTVATRLSR